MKLIWNMNVLLLFFLSPTYSLFDSFFKANTPRQFSTFGDWFKVTEETPKGSIRDTGFIKAYRRKESFQSENSHRTRNPLISTYAAPTTSYPCLYGVCNGTCCESSPTETFFDCANGQKINRSLVCNRENDCDDGSDESRCAPWPPKMTVLPKHKVEVYCGDNDKENAGTMILECNAVGNPTPLIRWKKYEGHVPSKCQQYSKNGNGILTCPNFQQSDQGAYSCVAVNSVKSAESQPKAIAKCSNTISCRGFRVVNEEKIEHCLECFCSGRTTNCEGIKSGASLIEIAETGSKNEIFVDESGKVLFIPSKTKLTPEDSIRQSSQWITYCSWTGDDLTDPSLLKSYGRNIIIPRYMGQTDFLQNAPTLIIQGNGLSLMYTANFITPPKENVMDVPIRFWPGNWHHLNKKVADRNDLMKVLSKVDHLFVRCEYREGEIEYWNSNKTILLESSLITGAGNSVSYVEKCSCPLGYDGLSCETCAEGYEEKPQGASFVCEKIYVPPPPCKEGYTGVNCSLCETGYIKRGNACIKPSCHPDGSISTVIGLNGRCYCKEGVTGDYCDQCKSGYFNLNKVNGCDKCWCSGVTDQCTSSKLYRTVISNIPRGGYNYSDGRNFWLLPPDFSGNRLTSYGGFLNYTMTYKSNIPKEKEYLTVEFLSMEDITLSYTHTTVDTSLYKNEKSWSVPIIEGKWKKAVSKSPVSKHEFLTVLSRIKAIYIESPYHLSSGLVNLTSTLMSSASSSEDYGGDRAVQVEQCDCPEGYTGLSCEKCSEGYYKKRNGTLTMCSKCNCNYCDPDFGCPSCPQLSYRDNPEEEKIPVCKPCPCQENGVSCIKDDYNQIFCRCKPGYTGMHCEIAIPEKNDNMTIIISPRRVKSRRVGTVITFNCSVITSEEMTLSARTSNGTASSSLVRGTGISTTRGREIWKTFEISLEAGLEAIECFVHDSDGRLAGHAVAVVEEPIIVTKPVEITNCYSVKIDVKESDNKDLICQATGLPRPMINWYKINGSKTEKVDSTDGVHSIISASLSQNGTVYTCIAENSRGDKATCTRVLIVQKKCDVVNISPNPVKVEEGQNVTIVCKTTAQNPVTWSRLTVFETETRFFRLGVTEKDGVLRITNSTTSDSGTYICSATTSENKKINGTVSVTVREKKEPPSVTILEYDRTLKVNETFIVHCSVKGKPVPQVSWNKLNGFLDSNVYASGNTLTITKATTANSGVYVCEARSKLGNDSAYISINVKYDNIPPKVIISERNIEAPEGSMVNLSCSGIGYPRPKLTWTASNVTILSSVRLNNTTPLPAPYESETVDLSFKVSSHLDNSYIICISENIAGKASEAARIKVLEGKGGIEETVEFVPIGSYFEIDCGSMDNSTLEKVGGLVGDECPTPKGLMIPSVQRQHNGTYIYKVQSEIKKIVNLVVVGFVPKFSRDLESYLVLPVQLNSTNRLHIELTFKAAKANGLILQKKVSKLDFYLHDSRIHLRFYSKAEDTLDVNLRNQIELEKWYSLVVSINPEYIDITVYNEAMSIHERKTEHFKSFDIDLESQSDSFFLGGPVTKAGDLRPRHSHHLSHFEGCISRLIVDRHEFDIVREGSYSQKVTLCQQCSEKSNLCLHRGKCLDAPTQYGFICVCPNRAEKEGSKCSPSCAGKGCETKFDFCKMLKPCSGRFPQACENGVHSLSCQCPYGYTGTTCDKVAEYSFCSNGTGYVRLHSKLLERRPGMPSIIRMSFTLHKLDGQLLWQGNPDNHLSISVHQGKLNYVYFNQNTKLEIHTAPLKIHDKYLFTANRTNGSAFLEVIGAQGQEVTDKNVYRSNSPKFHTSRVTGDIYLGGVPNNSVRHNNQVGLSGCIHYVSFGDKAKINIPEKALERVNVFSASQKEAESDENEDNTSNELDSEEERESGMLRFSLLEY